MKTAFTRRIAWTLFALCLPVLVHAAEVTKFVSTGEHTYLEVLAGNRLQKIYTEHNGDDRRLLVFGANDNPELVRISFLNSAKSIETWEIELRSEKGVVSPGVEVASSEFLKSLRSDEKGFADWQARFASFPETRTERTIVTDRALADPIGVPFFEEGQLVFRTKYWFCQCRRGALTAVCIISTLRCVYDNLCTVAHCEERGEWTEECHNALEEAKGCLGEFES